MATVGGGEVEEASSSSSNSSPLCIQAGQLRLVTPLEGWLEEVIKQPGQDPGEVRALLINSRLSQHLTGHPGPASGVGEDIPGVAGVGVEEVELTT